MSTIQRSRRIEERLRRRLMDTLCRQAAILTPEELEVIWDTLDAAARRADPSYRTPTPDELEAMPEPRLAFGQIRWLLTAMQVLVSRRPPQDDDATAEMIMAAAAAICARREVVGQVGSQ